jgi:phage terminase large subunit-like protein
MELEQAAEKAARMPSFENSFRNLYLNQRVNMVSAFVSASVWKAGNGAPGEFDGVVYGGLDLSATTDLTASFSPVDERRPARSFPSSGCRTTASRKQADATRRLTMFGSAKDC